MLVELKEEIKEDSFQQMLVLYINSEKTIFEFTVESLYDGINLFGDQYITDIPEVLAFGLLEAYPNKFSKEDMEEFKKLCNIELDCYLCK